MWLKTLFQRKINVADDLSDEIEIVRNDLRVFRTKITRLEAEVLDIATAQDIIRNKVLRKIQTKKGKEEEETEAWAGIPLGGD